MEGINLTDSCGGKAEWDVPQLSTTACLMAALWQARRLPHLPEEGDGSGLSKPSGKVSVRNTHISIFTQSVHCCRIWTIPQYAQPLVPASCLSPRIQTLATLSPDCTLRVDETLDLCSCSPSTWPHSLLTLLAPEFPSLWDENLDEPTLQWGQKTQAWGQVGNEWCHCWKEEHLPSWDSMCREKAVGCGGLGGGGWLVDRSSQEETSRGHESCWEESRLQETQEQIPWPRSKLEATWSWLGQFMIPDCQMISVLSMILQHYWSRQDSHWGARKPESCGDLVSNEPSNFPPPDARSSGVLWSAAVAWSSTLGLAFGGPLLPHRTPCIPLCMPRWEGQGSPAVWMLGTPWFPF